MVTDLSKVDPQWAWSPYEPSDQRPWNRRAAAHLFRRAGYAANSQELDEAVRQAPRDVIERLITGADLSAAFEQEIDQLAESVLASGDAKNLTAWWLYRAIRAPDMLHDKMTLFWHGHFAASAEKVQDARTMYLQHLVLRKHAMGSFAELVQAISRDPAMLLYLDSVSNRKRHPNENYARELMELFCLGTGHYSEKDIREIARCFTGWEVRRRRFLFNKYQHDAGEKSFLGQRGKFTGEDAVRIVVDQPAAAEFVARKLVRYFVADDVELPRTLIAPIADEFRATAMDTSQLVRRILSSQLLFSEYAVGRKVRSPVELGVGLMRALEGTTNTYRLAEDLAQLGQQPFFPPSVKGWDGGRTWINSSTLLGRANLVARLMKKQDATRFAGGSLAELVDRHGLRDGDETVDWLLDLLVAVPVSNQVRARLVSVGKETRGDRNRKLAEVVHLIGTLPEFQLA